MAIVTVAVLGVGLALGVGVPIGIVAGRAAWIPTADAVYVRDDPLVSVAGVAATVAGALLAARLASAWPAWRAAHGPATHSLRTSEGGRRSRRSGATERAPPKTVRQPRAQRTRKAGLMLGS